MERCSTLAALEPGAVHVWTAHLDANASTSPLDLQLLDDDERRRAGKIIVPRGRERYVAAHLFLRRALSDYTAVQPQSLSFERDSRGKPSLSHMHGAISAFTRPFFSLSHSRDSAALAVALSAEVGIDIEEVRELEDLEQLSRRYLTSDENQFVLGSADAEERTTRFFRVWTRKEAVLKALGVGISVSLSSFSVLSDDPDDAEAGVRLPSAMFPRAGEIVHVCDASPGIGYAAAVASLAPIRRLISIER